MISSGRGYNKVAPTFKEEPQPDEAESHLEEIKSSENESEY
jgi:hypothetical protein